MTALISIVILLASFALLACDFEERANHKGIYKDDENN